MTGVAAERARLYQTVRSAHLERARVLAPATILYRATRYDFDRALARDLDLVPAGPVRAAWLLARSQVRQLEVNEPLMLASLRRTALALAVLRLRHRFGGPRTQCVSYAIENANPFARPAHGRARLTRLQDRLLARFVWASLDRVAFGTEAAQHTYASVFGTAAGPAQRTLPRQMFSGLNDSISLTVMAAAMVMVLLSCLLLLAVTLLRRPAKG